jgi:TonB family protein
VLAAEPDVRRYGRLLLEVAERTRRHALPMAAFAESRSFLERRIRMMTNRQARNRAGWALAVAVSLVAAPVALLALPAPAPVGVDGVRGAVAGWARAQRPAQAAPLPAPRDTISVGAPYAYRAEELDRRPRLVNPGEIQSLLSRLYPPELQAAKVGGSAVVQFVVAADGTVDSSTVTTIRGTDPRFGEASVAAARRFRFQPGVLRGKNVRVLIQMPVTWQPDDGAPASGGQGVGIRSDTVPRSPADFSGIGRADNAPRDSTRFQYEVAVLDTKPDLLNKQEVAGLMNRFYPRALREAGIGGPVVVQFVIQPDGAVDPTTLKVISATDPQLGTASILVAERFRFRPGMMNGTPRRVLIQMPITWQPPEKGVAPKGFQELIPPKEPPPARPDVDISAPVAAGSDTVPVRDFSGIGVATPAPVTPENRASIIGRVLDREGRPIAGASVAAPAVHRGAITRSDGRFAILLPAGTHHLEVSGPGWPRKVTLEVAIRAGETGVTEFREPAR